MNQNRKQLFSLQMFQTSSTPEYWFEAIQVTSCTYKKIFF